MSCLQKALYSGRVALVIDIHCAQKGQALDLRLGKLCAQVEKHDAEVVVFDYSKVTSFDGIIVALPRDRIRNLQDLGIDSYVILSDEARAYLRRVMQLDFFIEISGDQLECIESLAA